MSSEPGTRGTSTDDAAVVVGSEEKAVLVHRGSPADDKGGTVSLVVLISIWMGETNL
jgi:hypothetical protein